MAENTPSDENSSNGKSTNSGPIIYGGKYSLPKEQARQLTTTHKTRPQMEAISSRNLIKVLPWVNVTGGFYRVNRRQMLEVHPYRVTFKEEEDGNIVIHSPTMNQMPIFKNIKNEKVLDRLAQAAVADTVAEGENVVSSGDPATMIYIFASGKVAFFSPEDEDEPSLGTRGKGYYIGEFGLITENPTFDYNAKALKEVKLFKLKYEDITKILSESEDHQAHLDEHAKYLNEIRGKVNRKGESIVDLHSGLHDDEPNIPMSYVAYDDSPREYELDATQTVLKIHSKIADLHNNPYNQTEEQIRLAIEELKERQEYEMINNERFGLLHNVHHTQHIHTESGAPTPDDLDNLISRRRKTQYILAHPRAIAAFTRECTNRGIYPATVEFNGREVPSWRGIPILTCNKLQVDDHGFTSMIAIRVGEENQGVVGLYQVGIAEEVEPSLSVRFMGINEKAIISYLITNYFSVAVLVSDALGVLDHVQVDKRL